MRWGNSRRGAMPAGPPDPDAIRRLVAAERLAQQRRWQRVVIEQVMPLVNAALGSTGHKETHIRPLGLTILGSWNSLVIRKVDGADEWVAPLLGSLAAPTYERYIVSLFGLERTAALPHTSEPLFDVVEIDLRLDLSEGMSRFRAQHPRGFFEIRIRT